MRDAQVYAGAAALGVVAGMRSMVAPVIVSKIAQDQGGESALGFLGLPLTRHAMTVIAAGEQIADKLPFIPNRTTVGPLIVRAISGGLSGAALCTFKKRSIALGALCGALGAIGATYAAFEFRKRGAKNFHVPDRVLALMEDAVTAGCAKLLVSQFKEDPAALPAPAAASATA